MGFVAIDDCGLPPAAAAAGLASLSKLKGPDTDIADFSAT